MSRSQTRRANKAAESLANGSVIGMGTYTALDNGGVSLKAVLARSWSRHHDLEGGANLSCWMDAESGALIILPEDENER